MSDLQLFLKFVILIAKDTSSKGVPHRYKPDFFVRACLEVSLFSLCKYTDISTTRFLTFDAFMQKVPLWCFDQGECCEEENSSAHSLQQNRQSDSTYQGIYPKTNGEGNVKTSSSDNFCLLVDWLMVTHYNGGVLMYLFVIFWSTCLPLFCSDKLRASRSAISAADIANEFTLGVPGEAFSFSQCQNKVTVGEASALTGEISQVEQFIREHIKP